jgi:hypothetical protein
MAESRAELNIHSHHRGIRRQEVQLFAITTPGRLAAATA